MRLSATQPFCETVCAQPEVYEHLNRLQIFIVNRERTCAAELSPTRIDWADKQAEIVLRRNSRNIVDEDRVGQLST
jgi:hypothetical protein